MTLTTGQDEQVTEFRVGTVNDLLIAAKGGTTDASGEVKRFKSLALAGGVSSAVLALALVVALISGTGSKSSSKSGSTTGTTLAPLPAPPGTAAPSISIPGAQAEGLKQGDHISISGPSRDGTATITIADALILSLVTQTNTTISKSLPASVTTTARVAIPKDKFQDFGNIDQRKLTIALQSSTPSTAPPATQPPATQPATTPPSS
jgi:hypothetical protein